MLFLPATLLGRCYVVLVAKPLLCVLVARQHEPAADALHDVQHPVERGPAQAVQRAVRAQHLSVRAAPSQGGQFCCVTTVMIHNSTGTLCRLQQLFSVRFHPSGQFCSLSLGRFTPSVKVAVTLQKIEQVSTFASALGITDGNAECAHV